MITISDEEIKQDSKNVVENISSELKQVINDTKSKFLDTEGNTKFEEGKLNLIFPLKIKFIVFFNNLMGR